MESELARANRVTRMEDFCVRDCRFLAGKRLLFWLAVDNRTCLSSYGKVGAVACAVEEQR